jgi:hypothetical protein
MDSDINFNKKRLSKSQITVAQIKSNFVSTFSLHSMTMSGEVECTTRISKHNPPRHLVKAYGHLQAPSALAQKK